MYYEEHVIRILGRMIIVIVGVKSDALSNRSDHTTTLVCVCDQKLAKNIFISDIAKCGMTTREGSVVTVVANGSVSRGTGRTCQPFSETRTYYYYYYMKTEVNSVRLLIIIFLPVDLSTSSCRYIIIIIFILHATAATRLLLFSARGRRKSRVEIRTAAHIVHRPR